MGFLNRRKGGRGGDAHLNYMGGPSYAVADPLARLRLAASSCFFGEPMYYARDRSDGRKVKAAAASCARLSDAQVAHLRATLDAIDPQEWRGLTPAKRIEAAVDAALEADPAAALAEAVRLRQQEHIRVTPQVILVRAAHHPAVRGTGLVRAMAPEILGRADEPATGLAYHLSAFADQPLPNALKRAWRDALERFDEYQLAKYQLRGRAVKTVDVVNLVHPRSAAVDALVRGTLSTSGRTWEAILSERGSSAAAWEQALEVMGHMALLRNLRNLLQAGVPTGRFLRKLVDGVRGGRQLPFRYYAAWRAVGELKAVQGVKARDLQAVQSALEDCLDASLEALPRFGGRVMSLCDNSGSARGTTTSAMGSMQISTIANLTAVLAAQRADDGYVGVFGDRLEVAGVQRGRRTLRQLAEVEALGDTVGGATENGIWLFWDRAIRRRERWDHVFVFSDMQAGHGGLYGTDARQYSEYIWSKSGRYIDVPALIARYRQAVNPRVRVYLVQVAGYQDTLAPEFYDKTYILGGWGPGLFRFAAEMAGIQ